MPDDAFDLGPLPDRFPVTEDLARRLVADQFPQWSALPVRPVAHQGWDNRTFHLGPQMSVRMPSAAPYALAVAKEHRWLPALASQLPLPIPVPVAAGSPGGGYPYPWSVYRWLDGETASRENVADLSELGTTLAGFLGALQRVDASGGPGPGLHNWYRGGPLTTYDDLAREALETLEGHVRTDHAREIWQVALQSRHDGPPVWFHGDMDQTNLLVQEGSLAAVIDFGTCGVGDPACDLAIAWTLLTGDARTVFRRGLSVDDDTWDRGRGWALWKTLAICAACLETGGPELEAATYVLDEIVEEYQQAT